MPAAAGSECAILDEYCGKGEFAVNTDGSRALAWRIAQHQQWRQAAAVLRGEQEAVDPDGHALVDMAEDLRIYARAAGEPSRKRLVDGRWEREYD
jgi:hypothetical protein